MLESLCYHPCACTAVQELYGPKYGEGDTIGLVYNRAVRTVSYTRNGQHLGVACRGVPVDGQSLMVGFRGTVRSKKCADSCVPAYACLVAA